MNLPIDLLIVDLDGTLVDSFDDIAAGLRVAVESLGAAMTPELAAMSRRGIPLEGYYRAATARDPGAASERQRFAAFVATYRQHHADDQASNRATTRPYPGVAKTLATLRQRRPGLRIAVGTSKRTDMARDVVTRAGLDDFLDLVQGSDHVAKKPDPALLRLIAETMDIPLARAAMVGDTAADIGAAHAAGCPAIAVTYGGQPRHELEAHQPTHLIDAFSEILDLL